MANRKCRRVFDRAYYDRFYRDRDDRVISEEQMEVLGRFVCSYLDYLGLQVSHVLDIGCGLGWWQGIITAYFPSASYTGVELSEYLCDEYGWTRASVVDYRSSRSFDLVICQGVLQYLDDGDAATAIINLGKLCRGALFLEVLTREDWEHNCDQAATDNRCHLREARWYASRLAKHFTNCGGGVFVSKRSEHYSYALDRLD